MDGKSTTTKTEIISKAERVAKEKAYLVEHLTSSDFADLRTRVAYILNHHKETRNSDVALQLQYWKTFQPELLESNYTLNQKALFQLERLTSISRARAKIQNEYGLFQADEEIKGHRRGKEARQREEELSDKPDIPIITAYIDESGKSDKFLVVGGLWILSAYENYRLRQFMEQWKKERKINYEFHLKDLTKNKLHQYKDFFSTALCNSSMIGFKAVAVKLANIRGRSNEEIVYKLYYELILRGINHEVKTGRAILPLIFDVKKDSEQGTDPLFLANMERDLTADFSRNMDGKMELKSIASVDSRVTPLMQLADLFIGSVARKLNSDNATNNQKAEFADYVMSELNLNIGEEIENQEDFAFIHII